jgi:hypothetical protein
MDVGPYDRRQKRPPERIVGGPRIFWDLGDSDKKSLINPRAYRPDAAAITDKNRNRKMSIRARGVEPPSAVSTKALPTPSARSRAVRRAPCPIENWLDGLTEMHYNGCQIVFLRLIIWHMHRVNRQAPSILPPWGLVARARPEMKYEV